MHIGTYDTNNSVLECTTYFDDALQVVIFSAEALHTSPGCGAALLMEPILNLLPFLHLGFLPNYLLSFYDPRSIDLLDVFYMM